ncbi:MULTISPECIES: MFS transporter [unclassified Streptomyces]|uniref:MFS transporter n=1 Tax=unclassified Streptomyces TaxID=2593676 RepID=UPI000DC7A9AA|nr:MULTISPECIES: MFS transporter [unclassified Streptomyces]AWZ03730.1 MFS transporter [Streptomyces sp. ICC4]AWZ11808.1 MFS transporter [Streptomyces sp. ICC1]
MTSTEQVGLPAAGAAAGTVPAAADTAPAQTGTVPAAARRPRRELAAATVGSVVEAYDWTIYGILAPYFAEALFPGSSPTAKLIAAYLGFALGFLVRPLGSVLIGRLTDTRGRRYGLTLTVGLIAAGSLLLAVVPGYASIGLAAPLLVVGARLVQGLSVGAENPSVAAYVTETAPAGRRYFYSAVSYAGVVLGSALSFIVMNVLLGVFGESGVEDGGWRYGFVFGGLLGLTALWIRRGAAESAAFTAAAAKAPSPWPVLRSHLGSLAVVFAITSGATTAFYFVTVDFPSYAASAGAATKEETSAALLLGMAALLAAMLGGGKAADRFGALPVLRTGFAGLALGTVPLLAAMTSGRVPVQLVTVVLLFLLGLPLAVSNVFAGRMFPTAVRAVAVGLPTAAAISLFGGTFPMLAELLRSAGHNDWLPWWPALTAAAALAASWGVREHPTSSVTPHV